MHTVESEDENTSDYDDEIKTVDLNPDDEINAVTARKFPKRLFATINVGKTPGASCSNVGKCYPADKSLSSG